MSQEGSDDLPREVQWSHDHDATGGPGGITPAIVEPAIVTPASSNSNSNSNSAGELASGTDYAGSMPASPVVALHAGEDNNAGSKLASPVVLHAGEDKDAGPKPTSPAVLHAGEDNPTEPKFSSPAVVHASEDNDPAGHKLAIQAAMPHASEDEDNNADGSKLTFPAVLCASEDPNAGSKMESPMLHVSADDNAGFEPDGPAMLDAELASQGVPHAGEGKDNDASPAVINAGEDDDNKAGSKLSIQETPHAVEDDSAESNSKLAGAAALQDGEGNSAAGDDESTELKLSMPAAMLHAGEGNNVASKFDTEASPHSSEDNDAGSKLPIPSGVDAAGDNSYAKEGKNGVAGEEGGEATVAAIAGSGGAAPSNTVKDAPAAVVANRGRGRGRGRGKGKGKSVATAEEKAMHIWTEKERRKKMKTMFGSLHALLPQLPEKADKSTIVGEAVTYIKSLEGTVKSLETLKQERIRAQQVAAGAGCSRAPPAFPAPSPPPAAPAPTREAILADMVQSWNAQEDLMAELRAAASAVVVAASAGSSTTSAAAAAAPAPAAPAPAAVPPLQTWSGPNIVVCVAGHDAFINICTTRRPGMLTRMLAVLEKHRVGVVTTTVSSDQLHTFFSIQARINAATPAPPMLPENVTVLDRYKLAVSEMLHAVAN
ncbi:unnamed protein product [Urochloa decumbens]|uniref:BHLH domain-containing protein n=1 Tax=Urochloa decumbens TaxID=240449 RepID=A0ABC9CB09_9POAL